MPKLESLGSKQRKMLEGWPCPEFAETPWTAMNKPLSDCRVALVTTAGLHVRGDKPFISAKGGGDTSYRVIPRSTTASAIVQSHTSIGFDRTMTFRDLNVTFPIDRLQELVEGAFEDSEEIRPALKFYALPYPAPPEKQQAVESPKWEM